MYSLSQNNMKIMMKIVNEMRDGVIGFDLVNPSVALKTCAAIQKHVSKMKDRQVVKILLDYDEALENPRREALHEDPNPRVAFEDRVYLNKVRPIIEKLKFRDEELISHDYLSPWKEQTCTSAADALECIGIIYFKHVVEHEKAREDRDLSGFTLTKFILPQMKNENKRKRRGESDK